MQRRSAQGRSLIVKFTPEGEAGGSIDLGTLTALQVEAARGLYAQAMAAYVRHVARDRAATLERLDALTAEYKAKAKAAGVQGHARTPGILADLAAGYRSFLEWAVKVNAAGRWSSRTPAKDMAPIPPRAWPMATSTGRCIRAAPTSCSPTAASGSSRSRSASASSRPSRPGPVARFFPPTSFEGDRGQEGDRAPIPEGRHSVSKWLPRGFNRREIMRVHRSLFPLAFVLVVTLGLPVLLSGCLNDSNSDGVQVDANEQERKLLQDRIQKGIAKRPVTKNR